MIKELITYCFKAKLQYIDKDDYYVVPYQVVAKDKYKAKSILWEWLSNPRQTGYKYRECVGIVECPTIFVLLED